MQNFVYLIVPTARDRLVVVDPAWQPELVLARAAALGRNVTDIVLTHHHADHCNAVGALLDIHPARIHVQKSERPWLDGVPWRGELVLHEPGDRVALGQGEELLLLHTPGHTPGSQCIACGESLLTGDTLFVDGCGRCDLPGGDPRRMFQSLRGLLQQLPPTTRLLPGHDYAAQPEATLAEQQTSNPYLQFAEEAAFIAWRQRPRG